jgi:ribosome-dependent ATPase
MPRRAEIVRGYVQGMHMHWLQNSARKWLEILTPREPISIETRFLYNPDVKSVPAMVPGVIALLLIMIPAILSSLSVVREKELGSIINFYTTPVTRLEFLIGKQTAYVILAMINFILLVGVALLIFDVPLKGSFLTLAVATFIYVIISTSIGLLFSTLTSSQVAAIVGTAIITMVPTLNFSGLLDPISSLEGVAYFIGHIFPTSYYLTIARGTFSKGLSFHDLQMWFIPLILTIPILLGLTIALLRKQER